MFNILKNFPKGLFALSSIEMWERFSFYTMQSILVLYASSAISNGGLGWSSAASLRLTGIYGALVSISPVIGGYIADKVIGRYNAMLIGTIVMMFGHAALAIHTEIFLFSGLLLLILGCGLMKPAISAMVGELYSKYENGSAEIGFAIFYMAINIGGFIGPLIAGIIAQKYNYNNVFLTAASGLIIAIVNIMVTNKASLKKLGRKLKEEFAPKNIDWNYTNKYNFKIYLILCTSNILWNIFYALPYGLLTLYAEHNINRTFLGFVVPSTWYYSSYSILIIIFSPVVAFLYKIVEKHFKFSFTLSYKLAFGYILVALGGGVLLPLIKQVTLNSNYLGSSWYLIIFYSLFALSELLTVPVLLCAANRFAPHGFGASFVSMNMVISWGIGNYLGGEFSALTQVYNPINMFEIIIGLSVLFAILHICSDRIVEKNFKTIHNFKNNKYQIV